MLFPFRHRSSDKMSERKRSRIRGQEIGQKITWKSTWYSKFTIFELLFSICLNFSCFHFCILDGNQIKYEEYLKGKSKIFNRGNTWSGTSCFWILISRNFVFYKKKLLRSCAISRNFCFFYNLIYSLFLLQNLREIAFEL